MIKWSSQGCGLVVNEVVENPESQVHNSVETKKTVRDISCGVRKLAWTPWSSKGKKNNLWIIIVHNFACEPKDLFV